MHHVENNFFESDLSSTESYQRDDFLHFIHYYLKYNASVLMLPAWALQREHYDLFAKAAGGGFVWLSTMYVFW